MKNREALFPNRIKFTDEETGKQYIGKWDYADSPTEVGTKLTADVFLSDDNAAEYGIESEDPTPNEVFTVLSKHASRHASDGVDPIDPADIGAIPTSQKGSANGVASLDVNGKVTASQASSKVIQHASVTNYTMTEADMGKMHLFGYDAGSTATATITIPPLTLGDEFEVTKANAGVTLVFSAGDCTFRTAEASSVTTLTMNQSYGVAVFKFMPGNRWLVVGDVE